jgi:predicted nucleotidyltransferase
MIAEKDFLDFLKIINKHQVNYLVIGGYAMAAHDAPRYTKDLDIWIEREEINSEKVIAAICEFGFESLKLTKEDFLSSNVFVQIGFAPVRIDVTSDISGITFDEAYEGKKIVEIEGILIPVIGIEALIKNKQASGRLQDIADVEKLKKMLDLKKKKK